MCLVLILNIDLHVYTQIDIQKLKYFALQIRICSWFVNFWRVDLWPTDSQSKKGEISAGTNEWKLLSTAPGNRTRIYYPNYMSLCLCSYMLIHSYIQGTAIFAYCQREATYSRGHKAGQYFTDRTWSGQDRWFWLNPRRWKWSGWSIDHLRHRTISAEWISVFSYVNDKSWYVQLWHRADAIGNRSTGVQCPK